MKKAIIFDLDGVLVHTDRYHYEAWKELAIAQGWHFDEILNDRLRGVSRMESLEIILRANGVLKTDDEKQQLAQSKNETYRRLLSNMGPKDLSEEVFEMLQLLRAKGYLLAIGSSSKNAKFILKRIGLGNYFDAISDGTNITRSKPDPEVFLKAAAYLGVEPSECYVVEDALAGVEAAKAAGMMAVAVGDANKSSLADISISGVESLGGIDL